MFHRFVYYHVFGSDSRPFQWDEAVGTPAQCVNFFYYKMISTIIENGMKVFELVMRCHYMNYNDLF